MHFNYHCMNMETNRVKYDVSDRVGYITLNRPEKRNALNFDFVQEIKQVFKHAESDTHCKVVVIRSLGAAFCAGADLAYLQQLQNNTYDENLADSRNLMELFEMIYHSSKIVIAQVHGSALAGGCGLATVCDFAFATPESTFGYTEVKIGFIPAIVMVFLLRKVSEKTARELLLTGKVIDAHEAKSYQLINDVVSPEVLSDYVKNFATKLCTDTSAQSVATVKKMISEVQQMSVQDALNYAANMNAVARQSDDCKKGIAAFLNKDKIVW